MRKINSKKYILIMLRIICATVFVIFSVLFINKALLEPMRANQAIDHTRELYRDTVVKPSSSVTPLSSPIPSSAASSSPADASDHDKQGRFLTFQKLLSVNPDTKGWLTFPGTNIDYAVMQRRDDPDYYLTHDFYGNKQKAGCLFLDPGSSIETSTKNLVIHGHNMKSTDNMFHYLEHMKDIDYFKKHTEFRFDTLYQTGKWKIFSVFITNGSDEKEPFFDYMQASFRDSSEFLNFVYQLRIRSIYQLDQVDVNENDQLCTLSTCSYELKDYRLVIVARKERTGSEKPLDTTLIARNRQALYPQSYDAYYGLKAATYPATFEEAMKQGIIHWYSAPGNE